MSTKDYATKQDVENIVGRAVTEISGVIGDTMQLISERFDKVDEHLDKNDADHSRIENKLDATIYRVDQHDTAIRAFIAQA